VTDAVARESLRLGAAKLPLKTRVVSRIVEAETMKAAQVRGMTVDQLNDELVKLKKEQFNLRFPGGLWPAWKTRRG